MTYERSSIQEWFRSHSTWPMDPSTDYNGEHLTDAGKSVAGPSHQPRGFSARGGKPYYVVTGNLTPYIIDAQTSTIMSILIDDWTYHDRKPSRSRFWQSENNLVSWGSITDYVSDLKDYGDGRMSGTPLDPLKPLHDVTISRETIGHFTMREIKLKRESG